MKKAVSLQIYGKVQGVWFRASTQMKARELGITGFVKNQSDGSVYIEAEGYDKALATFVGWCNEGPKHAQVTEVVRKDMQPVGFDSFDIRRW